MGLGRVAKGCVGGEGVVVSAASVFVAGVMGGPQVAQSLSPAIFRALGRAFAVPVSYHPWPLQSAEEQEGARRFLRQCPNVTGFNVTAPLKQIVHGWVDHCSDVASRVRAVNVVAVQPGSSSASTWVGHNTDVLALQKIIRRHDMELAGKEALVLGAGGAARAVLYGLAAAGVQRIWVVNRSPQKATSLLAEFQVLFPQTVFVFLAKEDWQAPLPAMRVIVNAATPAAKGGGGNGGGGWLEQGRVPVERKAWAVDLVYGKAVTPFLQQQVNGGGCLPVSGLELLIDQALESWKIWQGADALAGQERYWEQTLMSELTRELER